MPFDVKHSLTERQVHDLVQMYQNEWWTKRRALSQVEQLLKHSDLIVGICEGERLVAFARVLTDFVFKAVIYDVIVDAGYRSQGLGRQLMDTIVNHPSLQSVKHLDLYCLPPLLPFYEQWGFTSNLGELRFMRLSRS
ncbi:GCN5 family acetyltransferase [Planctomycetaceae bacterium SCGC AG-212-F19]|nr:GCN5 family acetyltransferase [Planctomycetaceae bacterium SCGC AG-212-F19]